MIGTKFYKNNLDSEAYTKAADWCNNNNATIQEIGDYYEVVHLSEPSLEEIKSVKITELKLVRDTKEVEPIKTKKGFFDYDDKSRDRLAIARQALTDAGGGEIVWTTADNQRVSMTISDFVDINSAAAMRSDALHIQYNTLKEIVNSAETKEEVELINWSDEVHND